MRTRQVTISLSRSSSAFSRQYPRPAARIETCPSQDDKVNVGQVVSLPQWTLRGTCIGQTPSLAGTSNTGHSTSPHCTRTQKPPFDINSTSPLALHSSSSSYSSLLKQRGPRSYPTQQFQHTPILVSYRITPWPSRWSLISSRAVHISSTNSPTPTLEQSLESLANLPPGYIFYPNHNNFPFQTPTSTPCSPSTTEPQSTSTPSPPPHLPHPILSITMTQSETHSHSIKNTSPETIHTSLYPVPILPRTGLFTYLFPSRPGQSPLPYLDPNALALIDGLDGRTVTRGQVGEQARRLASGLRKVGVRRGEVACVFGMNSLEWVNAALGCQAAGVKVSPANYAYTARELAHQLTDSGASLIFVQPSLLSICEDAIRLLPPTQTIPPNRIYLLAPDSPEARSPSNQHQLISDLWSNDEAPENFDSEVDQVAYLCYSSGTTGLPKGVMTSHHNMTSQLQAFNVGYQKIKPGKDVVLGILPFSHIYGLTVVLHQPLMVGVPVVVLPRFEEIPVLTAIQKYKITHGLVVPPIMLAMVHSENVPKYDLSTFVSIQCGAAPLSADLCSAFERKLPGCKVTQGYGLTETSPVITVMTTEEARGRQGAVGRLLPTYQARLVDADTGEDAKPGERGELWVRGPSVMRGYLGNEEATKKTFAPGGWFKTGDVAVRDAEGYYTIVDRVKELIKYKGFQVAPAELESLLLTHDRVVDVGVIGVQSKSLATELPRAYVVIKPAPESPEEKAQISDEIIKWVAGRVAKHKQLRGGCAIIEAIPKSPSGKILRKVLREQAAKEVEQWDSNAEGKGKKGENEEHQGESEVGGRSNGPNKGKRDGQVRAKL